MTRTALPDDLKTVDEVGIEGPKMPEEQWKIVSPLFQATMSGPLVYLALSKVTKRSLRRCFLVSVPV
jgi:hypothetical protein